MTAIATITPKLNKVNRHSWAEPIRFPYKTERTCVLCGLTKVTRHEPGELPWLEFFRGLEKIECDRTPVCEVAR